MGEWTRRGFLGLLGSSVAASAAALELDPELALWVPGKKTFFLPPKEVRLATKQEVQQFLQPGSLTERYRLDIAGKAGDYTSLYFNHGWQLLRADRVIKPYGNPGWREPIQLTPEGIMVLEAELGEKLSSYARVGCEKHHGLLHGEAGRSAGANYRPSVTHLAARSRLSKVNTVARMPDRHEPLIRAG